MTGTAVPNVQNSMNGVIIRHKEFIGNVQPTTPFTVTAYDLNPGMDTTFPWLSQIAPAFQQYKWRGIIFTYKSTSADLVSGTNPSLGSIIMATDYNAAQMPIRTKREMLNYEFSTTTKPSNSTLHMVECARSQTTNNDLFFTRDGEVPQNQAKSLYDLGTFYIATDGMQSPGDSDAQIGELWVSYEVEFLKPKFSLSTGVEEDIFYFDPLTIISSDPTYAMPGGNLQNATRSGNLGCRLTYVGENLNTLQCIFPKDSSGKSFMIFYACGADTAGTGTGPGVTISTHHLDPTVQNVTTNQYAGHKYPAEFFPDGMVAWTQPPTATKAYGACIAVTVTEYRAADPPYFNIITSGALAVYPVFGSADPESFAMLSVREMSDAAIYNTTNLSSTAQ